MRTRAILVSSLLVAGLVLGALATPSPAAQKLEGHLTTPQVPAWLGMGGGETKAGSDTISALAFADACQADRDAYAAGAPDDATHIATFLESPLNGLDAYVFDLGKESPLQGEFFAEGPGPVELVPDAAGTGLFVNTYDLDLDFFTSPDVDADSWNQASDGIGCPNANLTDGSSDKCYSHSPHSHEKTSCIKGHKDSKKVVHGARYIMVSGSLNLIGPMPLFLTHP